MALYISIRRGLQPLRSAEKPINYNFTHTALMLYASWSPERRLLPVLVVVVVRTLATGKNNFVSTVHHPNENIYFSLLSLAIRTDYIPKCTYA